MAEVPEDLKVGQLVRDFERELLWICVGKSLQGYWHFSLVIQDLSDSGSVWVYRAKYPETLHRKFYIPKEHANVQG